MKKKDNDKIKSRSKRRAPVVEKAATWSCQKDFSSMS